MLKATDSIEVGARAASSVIRAPHLLIGLCLLLGIFGAAGGFAYYELATPRYMARMVVAPPNEQNDTQNVRVSFDVLRGGASSKSESHEQFLFQLTSYESAERLLKRRTLVDELIERRAMERRTVDELQRYLADTLQLNRPRLSFVEDSSFTELIIKDPNPRFAAELLSAVVSESDALVRARLTSELTASRLEIVRTLPGVTIAEYRESLIRLLAQVERQRIFAEVNPNFSFRTIDPLTTSSRPVEPRLLLSLGIGIFIGLTAAIALIVVWLTRITVFAGSRD